MKDVKEYEGCSLYSGTISIENKGNDLYFYSLPNNKQLFSINLIFFLGPASYAQTNVWLNEQTHFQEENSCMPVNNMSYVYCLLSNNTLSITHLYRSLQQLVNKHQSLRASVIFDIQENLLMQHINDFTDNNNKLFTFIESTFQTDEQLNDIIYNEKCNSQLFDLAQGQVFRCHLVYYKQIPTDDLLCDKDAIIFNFHHILFDHYSMNIFLRDLHQTYTTDQFTSKNQTTLRYLDCE
jgi:hypothetical protein